MTSKNGDWSIIYTLTDEAPLLATYSLLPLVNRFTKPFGIPVVSCDISVAHRVLNIFLPEKFPDNLKKLGDLTAFKHANIVKLPNVSASLPQLLECIKELQEKGFPIPDFNESTKAKYAAVLGSNVNPVLRQGNSDRRVAVPVKLHAKSFPHTMMKPFSSDSTSRVVHMAKGDFYESEQSAIMPEACTITFSLVTQNGRKVYLRDPLKLEAGEIFDSSFLSIKELRKFYKKELTSIDNPNQIVSVHLKATMMKVSDPIIFGYAVEAFYAPALKKFPQQLEKLGFNSRNGIGALYKSLELCVAGKGAISAQEAQAIVKELDSVNGGSRPEIAMVDSDKGITNLHVPSDVIIDASMPVVIRDGGKMWNKENKLKDVKCLIPDRCYATLYKVSMEFCKKHGAFNPATMGSVSNVGLMARKAEEYGSHDKTFELKASGEILIEKKLPNGSTEVLFKHTVKKGDIYRGCQAKKEAVDDWIKLAVRRGEATGVPVIFWLDKNRGHDAELIKLVNASPLVSGSSCDIQIMAPPDAVQYTMERSKAGKDTISVTGNVLRDYLTDLFPILELGTSAKMLSIVPLLAGGGLYETGAGGSAPKHAKQLIDEGHLRWDSLGEFLALSYSLRDLGEKSDNDKAVKVGEALEEAVKKLLSNQKSPGRKIGDVSNPESHFWLCLYWAKALAGQFKDFHDLYSALEAKTTEIVNGFKRMGGSPKDVGGYYFPDPDKAERVMRPVAVFNEIMDSPVAGVTASSNASAAAAAASRPQKAENTGSDVSVIYTLTDEAPLLATYSLLPIVNRFTKPFGIPVVSSDISVAHRVLNIFMPEKFPDNLTALGNLTARKEANIVKLPNISASLPQLMECISELQGKGYNVPDFSDATKSKYSAVLGSNVNPVLRQGNSDRRVAVPVKLNAKTNPHKMIKPYLPSCTSRVVHMKTGDFYESEKSKVMTRACTANFYLVTTAGRKIRLREPLALQKGELLDSAFLSIKDLKKFFKKHLSTVDNKDQILSVHLKATMMKVSDPIIFGYAVEAYYAPTLSKFKLYLEKLNFNSRNGIQALYNSLNECIVGKGAISAQEAKNIIAELDAVNGGARPLVAMVNSDKGITNFHVPSDVIIDASMPVVIRDGGKMWDKHNQLRDVKCVIPGRCYATMYKAAMSFCRKNGAFDPSKMGSVSNVGLMARKAEEYGSHDKTFELKAKGTLTVELEYPDKTKEVAFEHEVKKGDIYRACQTKQEAIVDWINLACERAEVTKTPVCFWLDENRGHDAELIKLIKASPRFQESTATIKFMAPPDAMQHTMERSKAGLDTISASGNVLRDYLTDLFPILELGTSAKMLSIVPLLAGGGLYETGAGGSAPKHAEQFIQEGHLRWDSLGEFLALSVSLKDLGTKFNKPSAVQVGDALEEAVKDLLANNQSPGRKPGDVSNPESHFWIALYWAKHLSSNFPEFKTMHSNLMKSQSAIVQAYKKMAGSQKDIGGYYFPDPVKAEKAMRPVQEFNAVIDNY